MLLQSTEIMSINNSEKSNTWSRPDTAAFDFRGKAMVYVHSKLVS